MAEGANLPKIERDLISEVGLDKVQARVYLLVTCRGRMSAEEISGTLGIAHAEASGAARDLMDLGAFIDITPTEFEAMHPRFTAVNMFRRVCDRKGIAFARNNAVDSIGAQLEEMYDEARTGRHAK